jgi:2-polyprenyl-3-methyl-5-hydroxy-6-metoxy-1,4-benzoquinol methylase
MVWDEYWQKQPLAVPSSEPAYNFVAKTVVHTFGRIKGLRTVELGAGRGDISFLLAKAGALVTLMDASEIALNQARVIFAGGDLKANFVLGNIFEEVGGTFDVAMSFGLVEHFEGAERRRLFEMHKWGKLGFVSVPNALCPPYRLWKFAREVIHRWPYGKEIPLTKERLRAEMKLQFRDVRIFTTPLSYNLWRKLGMKAMFGLPLDGWLGYQLVASGIN